MRPTGEGPSSADWYAGGVAEAAGEAAFDGGSNSTGAPRPATTGSEPWYGGSEVEAEGGVPCEGSGDAAGAPRPNSRGAGPWSSKGAPEGVSELTPSGVPAIIVAEGINVAGTAAVGTATALSDSWLCKDRRWRRAVALPAGLTADPGGVPGESGSVPAAHVPGPQTPCAQGLAPWLTSSAAAGGDRGPEKQGMRKYRTVTKCSPKQPRTVLCCTVEEESRDKCSLRCKCSLLGARSGASRRAGADH